MSRPSGSSEEGVGRVREGKVSCFRWSVSPRSVFVLRDRVFKGASILNLTPPQDPSPWCHLTTVLSERKSLYRLGCTERLESPSFSLLLGSRGPMVKRKVQVRDPVPWGSLPFQDYLRGVSPERRSRLVDECKRWRNRIAYPKVLVGSKRERKGSVRI